MGLSNRVEHILVTGASGYIGSRLVKIALDEERAVTILGRSDRKTSPGVRYVKWELGADLPDLKLKLRSMRSAR